LIKESCSANSSSSC